MPGDDPRHINWKLYARQHRLYVKEFDGDTNLNLYVLLDVSGSMACASLGRSKLHYAATLAAALAHLAIRQHDAAGITLFLLAAACGRQGGGRLERELRQHDGRAAAMGAGYRAGGAGRHWQRARDRHLQHQHRRDRGFAYAGGRRMAFSSRRRSPAGRRVSGVDLFLANPVGAKTGRLLPTGRAVEEVAGYAVSCVDVAVPMVIARAADFGKTAHEQIEELEADRGFLATLRAVWVEAGLRMGLKAPAGGR